MAGRAVCKATSVNEKGACLTADPPSNFLGALLTYCNEAIAVKSDRQTRVAVSLRCRSWTCQECAELRKDQLIAQTVGGAPWTFLTLTLRRSEASTPEQAAKKLSKAWMQLRARLVYWGHAKKIPFLAVFEAHQSGWPHLHIFTRMPYVEQRCLSGWMSIICNSPYVDVRSIKNRAMAAGYAAKYVTKQNVRFGTCKRYWQSPDYDLRPKHKKDPALLLDTPWEYEKTTLQAWAHQQLMHGWRVIEQLGHRITMERRTC